MAIDNNSIDMDKILLDYERKNREIYYDLSYKTDELEKCYDKVSELKKENFAIQSKMEMLKHTNEDLEAKLKHTLKRLATTNMATSREKALLKESLKFDQLILENTTLKEMLYKLQEDQDQLEQINSRNEAKYRCTLLNNEELIKDRNSLREHIEILTNDVAIKNKESAALQVVKENIQTLFGTIKESSFYITEINKFKELSCKQQDQLTYYRAYVDQLKHMIDELKCAKPSDSVQRELETGIHSYKHCVEEIVSIRSDLSIKLQNERKANEMLIKIDNLIRNKYNIAKSEIEEINSKYEINQTELEEIKNECRIAVKSLEEVNKNYNIAKNDLVKVGHKTLVEVETQTEI